MKVTICDGCGENRVEPLEVSTENHGEVQLHTSARIIGPKSMNLDLCWDCFDELRMVADE